MHDDVGRHLDRAGALERAAVPLGVYLAWCAQHHLLSDSLNERAGTLLTRIRYREAAGRDLAVAGCGGELTDEHLNAEGQAFTARHYTRYLEDFLALPDAYDAADDWVVYDRLAPGLTRSLMQSRGWRGRGDTTSAQRWWKFWQKRPGRH